MRFDYESINHLSANINRKPELMGKFKHPTQHRYFKI